MFYISYFCHRYLHVSWQACRTGVSWVDLELWIIICRYPPVSCGASSLSSQTQSRWKPRTGTARNVHFKISPFTEGHSRAERAKVPGSLLDIVASGRNYWGTPRTMLIDVNLVCQRHLTGETLPTLGLTLLRQFEPVYFILIHFEYPHPPVCGTAVRSKWFIFFEATWMLFRTVVDAAAAQTSECNLEIEAWPTKKLTCLEHSWGLSQGLRMIFKSMFGSRKQMRDHPLNVWSSELPCELLSLGCDAGSLQ